MSSIRLPVDYQEKLENIAEIENKTKSDVIKEALAVYFENYYQTALSYEIGKDLFGKYGSKKGNLSKDYKNILKGKLSAKHSH